MKQIAENLYLFIDTCNVYILRDGNKALLIDFGSGEVTKKLAEIGVEYITDIFITHHHRDQAQGLHKVHNSVRVWVPHTEYDLFANIDDHWQAREIYNNYNVRQDRFSILNSINVFGTLKDYSEHNYGDFKIEIVPTPGHTVGSVSMLVQESNNLFAFTGDLISHPGKVWSMSATQWSYNGAEGVAASILSLVDLKARYLDALFPSHGNPMYEPGKAMDSLIRKFQELLSLRNQYHDLLQLYEQPYEQITEHVLFNKTSFANSYVVLSKNGKALLIDYGYDFHVGNASGTDRSSRRPWLYTIRYLKEKYGVSKIDAVILTHFHDDHVAGLNLLRDVEGTSVWAAENFSDILENPEYYDLPCIWYDPIPVDQKLPLNQTIQWEEYEFTLHEQPGHALYAVAISFTADGKHFLAIGDQQDNKGDIWNYVYKNKFQINDYKRSGNLYINLKPDILLSGHWPPLKVESGYLEMLKTRGEKLESLHNSLLPLDDINMDAEGVCAWIKPYQIFGNPGEFVDVTVEILNPFHSKEQAMVKMVISEEWGIIQDEIITIDRLQKKTLTYRLKIPNKLKTRRERIAVDLSIGNYKLGQQAEALITIK